MGKIRIHEIAKEMGIKSKDIVEKAVEMGFDVKAASSGVSPEEAESLINFILTGEKSSPSSSAVQEHSKAQKDVVTEEKVVEPKPEPKPDVVKEKQPTPPPKQSVDKPQEEKPQVKKEEVKEEIKEAKVEASKALKTHAEEAKPAEKKVETPKVEEPPVKEKPSLSANVRKRRGLVIVKKNRRHQAAEAEKKNAFDDADVKSALKSPFGTSKKTNPIESVFGTSQESSKKKKKAKKTPSQKSSHNQKVNLELNMQMKDVSLEIEEEMVVLPDFTVKQEVKEVYKKKIDPSQMKSTKKSTFLNHGIQRQTKKRRRRRPEEKTLEVINSIEIPEDIRVYEFAEKINKSIGEVIKELFTLGVMVTKNDFLDKDAIEILADSFDLSVTTVDEQEEFDYVKQYTQSSEEKLVERTPVVTIMGHVDHGKTSLLDYIRSSKVASGEAGGITQHVGAYMVEKNGKNITFIDTPGHEAFTQMRSRGAEVTDVVIIVVAADDGVMPQTKEAIDHSKAANVPIIIAVNKMDKENANPDLVKSQLAELDITPVDWGGSYEFVGISAKTGMGIDELLEVILIQSEVLELKADPSKEAKAAVIESSVEKGKGTVSTVVIQDGTLHVGDTVVAGVAHGKVKALLDDEGNAVKSAKPGEPVVVLGLSSVPEAGETLVSVESDKIAREYAKKRAEYLRQKELSKSTKVTIDELSAMIAEGALKTLPVIIKADTGGSLEAIKGSLAKIKTSETKIDVISSGIGGITESDVGLAGASENCIILGFNVRPTGSVKERAKNSGVEIKTYNIIYDLIDDVKNLVIGMLAPVIREEHIGQAEVREVFNVPKIGAIAGCIVTDGSINRGVKVRLIREGVIVYEGTVSSLKRFKDDVKEVGKGYECGIGIDGFNDIKVGDYMESFKEVEERATL
ncbi:translation initiation factor IF-2 [Sulfurospirillum sp. 1612]|uniref:translation initiation factor IF-2 n=1 Tax=Sulfurospirillum sp. 1612 TaxID=3094835 RepID=UPI002F943B6E